VISPDLHEGLKGLGGFRNILVHNYADVDISLLYQNFLRFMDGFESFLREILTYIEQVGRVNK
jgi:uncharacterized protein YutE (UPF0331/DUF86 family)